MGKKGELRAELCLITTAEIYTKDSTCERL